MVQASRSILLVDDHPMLRKGVADLLELEDDLEVVGESSTGEDAIQQAVRKAPDLILLDMSMKGMNGIETLQALRTAGIEARIVVFSVSDDRDDVIMALKAGADGYLLKDMEPEDLVENIRKACSGTLVLSQELAQVLALALKEDKRGKKAQLETLTKREKQILQRIAAGLSNKVIARGLDITESTVKVHVKHILKKLKLSSRVEAAIWVVENKGK